jgi:arylsulfatase A-like enzyme
LLGFVSLQAATKPHIVFILVDDLAWADVGFNGEEFYETPHIDQLCKDGVKLDQMYSGGPNCSPTRACLISGMYPPRTQIYVPGGGCKGDTSKMYLAVPGSCKEGEDAFVSRMPEMVREMTSLAEVMKGAGYKTARFGKWHLGKNLRGFDVSSADGSKKTDGKFYGKPNVTDQLAEASIQFLKENKDTPCFVFLSLWDVHSPLKAKKELAAKYKKKNTKLGTNFHSNYAGMIEQVDDCVGNVRAAIEQMGIAENTLILFSSDNGGPDTHTDNAPLKGAKGSLYEGGVRVPSCVYWKGKTPSGATNETVITSVDMLPTFAELGGAELPKGQPVDGVSVVSAFLNQSNKDLEDRPVFWHFPHYLSGKGPNAAIIPPFGSEKGYFRGTPSSAMRKGDWKLIYFFETNTGELYNIKQDPYEKTDVAKSQAEIYQTMVRELKAWQKKTDAPVPQGKNPNFKKQK